MSNDVMIANTLPAQIVALSHDTLDEAMSLCERAFAIVIPSPTLDELGCRSALEQANGLYQTINQLSKALEEARLERGREITALKTKLDEVVKAARVPLEDQRSKLGEKLLRSQRELERVIAEKQRKAEEERRRIEEERRLAAEAARRAEEEAKAAAAAAEEAARKAREAAGAGDDPLPDDASTAAADQAAAAARDAVAAAEKAKAAAFDKVFDAEPAPYVAPAPKSAVKGKTTYELRIDDLSKVPREIGGVPLWKLDEPTALRMAKELARAGKSIPGTTLVEIQGTAAAGRSGAFGY